MTHIGYYPIPPEPEPGHTDPGEQVTPSDVVAMVLLRLDQTVTPEMWDAAEYGASLLLGALGALTPEEKQ